VGRPALRGMLLVVLVSYKVVDIRRRHIGSEVPLSVFIEVPIVKSFLCILRCQHYHTDGWEWIKVRHDFASKPETGVPE
jgi:hypothetical protein